MEVNELQKKSEFNILPLERGGIQLAIMQQPEVCIDNPLFLFLFSLFLSLFFPNLTPLGLVIK